MGTSEVMNVDWDTVRKLADVANMLKDMGYDAAYALSGGNATIRVEGTKICDDEKMDTCTQVRVVNGYDGYMFPVQIENHKCYTGICSHTEDIHLLKEYLKKIVNPINKNE